MNSTTAETTNERRVSNVSQKRVLNAGSGPRTGTGLHPLFRQQSWEELRLDIDPKVQPDILGSVTDMKTIADESLDAIWCSHNLEHLYNHEISKALSEFRRVLKIDGFSLITCPDLEEIAGMVASGKGEDVAYHSPVGPITAFDMLYGHAASIAMGNEFMAHRTGFTADRLGRMLVESGFDEVLVTKGRGFDLWALALMPSADRAMLQDQFLRYGLDFFAES